MSDWNWITQNIAIGSAPSASDVTNMQRQGITDVLDLRGEPLAGETGPHPEIYEGSGVSYHYVPMTDHGGNQPVSVFQQGVAVIRQALSDPNAKILVHCAAGQYRSPAMVYAYLRSVGYDADAAWNMIVSSRTVARRQYVPSAEAAVPYLNQYSLGSFSMQSPGAGDVGILLMVVGMGALAMLLYKSRHAVGIDGLPIW